MDAHTKRVGEDPMKLKITFKREAWLSLRCDGQLRFEGRASGGTEQEWPAASP